MTHLGSQVVYRIFEIGAKSGFKEPEQMRSLAEEEERLQKGHLGRGASDGGPWCVPRFENYADALTCASLHTSASDHMQILLEYFRWKARDCPGVTAKQLHFDFLYGNCHGLTYRPEGSPMDALEKLQLGIFWTICKMARHVADSDPCPSILRFDVDPIAKAIRPLAEAKLTSSASRHLEANAAVKLKALQTGPDLDPRDVFEVLSAVDNLHNRKVGSTYEELWKQGRSVERLARFKSLTMCEHEAGESRRIEQSERHPSTIRSETWLRKKWESWHEHGSGRHPPSRHVGLADLLMTGATEAPASGVDHLRLLLQHGTMFVANEELRFEELDTRRRSGSDVGHDVIVAPWIGAYNRHLLSRDPAGDDSTEATTLEKRLLNQIKELVLTMNGPDNKGGLNTMQWKQLTTTKVLVRALELLSLKAVFKWGKLMSGTSKKPLESMTIVESSISADISSHGVHLSDLCKIYCPYPGVKSHVRASEFRAKVKQYELGMWLRRSDLRLSQPSSPASSQASSREGSPSRDRSSKRVRLANVMPVDPHARIERYDTGSLLALVGSLENCSKQRQDALQVIGISIMEAWSERLAPAARDRITTLERQRHKLLRANDMLQVARALVAILDRSQSGHAVQKVTYDQPNGLGRQYARALASRPIESSLLDDDPAAIAQFRTQTGSTSRLSVRPVCYQGMHSDMRPVCGGSFLHDVDVVKCFPSLLLNEARRRGILPHMPTLVEFMQDPDSFLVKVVDFHNLSANQNQKAADAKGEAKALLNSLICGASYGKWRKERQVRAPSLHLASLACRSRMCGLYRFTPSTYTSSRAALDRDAGSGCVQRRSEGSTGGRAQGMGARKGGSGPPRRETAVRRYE